MRVEKVAVDGRPARWSHRGGKLKVIPSRPIDDGAAFAVSLPLGGLGGAEELGERAFTHAGALASH